MNYLTRRSSTPYIVHGHLIDVDDNKVEQAIESFKNKKASGPDGMPVELLKNETNKRKKLLKELFQQVKKMVFLIFFIVNR